MTISIDIHPDVLAAMLPAELQLWPYNRGEVEESLDYGIRKYLESQAFFEEKMVAAMKKELIALCFKTAKAQRGEHGSD